MNNFYYRCLLILHLSLLLSACDDLPTRSPPEAASVITPPTTSPDYLRLPLDGAVSTLDPGKATVRDAIELVEQLFLGLTDFDPSNYEVIPEFANSWTTSADGTKYTFNLRTDVQWTNGEPVTAHDIVWAIQRNLSSETTLSFANALLILKNAKQFQQQNLQAGETLGVTALDDYTVHFTLEYPASYFPALASTPVYRPLPRTTIEQYGEAWIEAQHIQSNGSYQVQRWEKGSVLILEKNPNYYAANAVNIPAIHYYIVPQSSLGLTMYTNNELDILGEVFLRIPNSDLLKIENNPLLRADLRTTPVFCTDIYGFNNSIAPTDNALVRKAIAAAVNKKMLIDFVFKGKNEVANTLNRPPIFGSVSPDDDVGIAFDPVQARRWLSLAGYPNGEGFPELVLMHNISETHSDVASAVKTMLKHYLNIDLTIRAVGFDEYLDTMEAQPEGVHLYRVGWCADYPDANNLLYEWFHPLKSSNYISWNNAEYIEVVEQAQRLSDPAQRRALYHRAEQILNEEQAAILPLYFSTATYLVKPRIKNWYGMAFGGQHIRNFSIQNDRYR